MTPVASASHTEDRTPSQRLRDENAKLRMEREILAKAAVFFAKESDGR
jgi:transposase-like protein